MEDTEDKKDTEDTEDTDDIDTQLCQRLGASPNGWLSDGVRRLIAEQQAWMDRELVAPAGEGVRAGGSTGGAGSVAAPSPAPRSPAVPVHTFVFSHIPPFIRFPDEPKGYFNLHPTIRGEVLAQLKRAGVSKWFCGHFHRNDGGWDEKLEVVITTAVGTVLPFVDTALEPTPEGLEVRIGLDGFDWSKRSVAKGDSGLRLVTVTKSAVNHRFYSLVDFSKFASNTCT
jgi:hypothetical protein